LPAQVCFGWFVLQGHVPIGSRYLIVSLEGARSRFKTGMGTMRDVEEFRIHPNTIKDLPTGRAVLITKIPSANARIARVVPGPRGADADDN
jgi:hypothetical protein